MVSQPSSSHIILAAHIGWTKESTSLQTVVVSVVIDPPVPSNLTYIWKSSRHLETIKVTSLLQLDIAKWFESGFESFSRYR